MKPSPQTLKMSSKKQGRGRSTRRSTPPTSAKKKLRKVDKENVCSHQPHVTHPPLSLGASVGGPTTSCNAAPSFDLLNLNSGSWLDNVIMNDGIAQNPSMHADSHRHEEYEMRPTSFTNSQCDITSSTPIAFKRGLKSQSSQTSFLTTPSTNTKNNLWLSNWGLPDKVLAEYSQRGITSMFKWQAECLMLPNVLTGGNIIFSAPTSSGKTLVAELLALKCVLETKKKVIFILPFVSIAHEKSNYLQAIFEPQGIRVGGFMGNQSPSGGFDTIDIAICTIEKANSLINHLLEERTAHNLGAVIVDELHMIGDPDRGYLLELLLTKLLYIGRTGKIGPQNIQIVGMSATLPNISMLATWLDAELYCTDFRPTPLQEMVKIGSTIYDTNFKKLREFDQSESIPGDEDNILLICRERILNGHSVLIFCPTKAWCENLATTLAEAQSGFINCNHSTAECGANPIDTPGLVGVCEQLRRTQVGLDHVLEKTIPHGVAFHHAGLTFEERDIIEGAFRQTTIKVLIATSTLSSGVNLPARLVIVRTPFIQRSLLDVLTYTQMVGRAGRKGVDKLGESILMCKPSERSKVSGMLKSAPKLIQSCLCSQRRPSSRKGTKSNLSAMKRALLEVIVSGTATTEQDIKLYVSCTLYFSQLEKNVSELPAKNHTDLASEPLHETLSFLLQSDFISTRTKPDAQPSNTAPSQEFYPTQLGVATVSSALSPDEALVVFSELRKARRNFVLENELHIIYLVTPVYIQNQWPNIDWYKYLCLWERLPEDMKHVSNILGVKESFLAQAIQGNIPERTDSQQESLRVHRRFFTALALHDLVHEVPILHVARQYGATKGLLQTLQCAAGTFAGMVTVFCSRLGWNNLDLLLSQFQNRLMFGIERELCELVRVSLLNGFRARVLYNAGYHTLAALATANPTVIETCLRNAIPFKSFKLADEDGVMVSCTSTWCAKLRKGMTENEAATLIVNEAKSILSKDLNVPLSAWNTVDQPQSLNSLSVPRSNRLKFGDKIQRKNTKNVRDEIGNKKPCIEPDSRPTTAPITSPLVQYNIPVSPIVPQAIQFPCPDFIPASALLCLPQDAKNSHPQGHIDNNMDPSRLSSNYQQPVLNLSPISISVVSGKEVNAAVKPITLEGKPEVKITTIADSFNKDDCNFENSLPFTIPDSLPCSADQSMSFSFQTFAMIDAVCDAACDGVRDVDVITGNNLHHEQMSSLTSNSQVPILDAKQNGHKVDTNVQKTPHKSLNISKYTPETPSLHYQISGLKELSSLCSSQLSQSGITVINVTSNPVLFDTFMSECLEQKVVAFSVASTCTEQSDAIGSVVVKLKSFSGIPVPHRNEQIIGITFCWGGMDVYYISLCKDPLCDTEGDFHSSSSPISLVDRIEALRKLFDSGQNSWEKLTAYDMKKHAKLLALSCGSLPNGITLDPIVANWMLNPDAKEKTIHRMVLQYLPDQPLLSKCEDYEEMPLSSLATNNGDPEMQASAESILAYMLSLKLTDLLKAEGLYNSYINVEMPLLLVLAKVEMNGIGFSPDECANQRDILQRRISELEKEAYDRAGHTFSLSSPEDVASVLFLELQLPSGCDLTKQRTLGTTTRRATKRRVQHLSTAKDVLEKIRPLHPLPGIVLEWRRISATITKMVYPLFKEAVLHKDLESFRIHANIQIHTATGRVSVSDPNLQMVPKKFDISFKTTSSIASPLVSDSQYLEAYNSSSNEDLAGIYSSVSMRNVFQPFPGAVFLSADYSQLELRILAHMSGDKKLQQFLNSNGDVFKMIAGEWLGLPASGVNARQRQEAKQVCYGMIYGIGPKALGDQLGIADNEAAQFLETFRSKYPTMKKFISKTIQDCRSAGHVTTLLNRKRFLPGIHSTNIHAKSQAERQAVNTTIQGSAADLVKTAMVNIDRKITQLYCTSGTCLLPKSLRHAAYLVLQLHDELLYEVLESDLEEVAGIVKHEMENALESSVQFPVKVKAGYSWGQLEPISF